MKESCDDLVDQALAAEDEYWDAVEKYEAVQERHEQYSCSEETQQKIEARQLVEEIESDMAEELAELEQARSDLSNNLESQRATWSRLDELNQQERDLTDQLAHLDGHIDELSSTLEALEGTWDPATESSPEYETTKEELDEVQLLYDQTMSELEGVEAADATARAELDSLEVEAEVLREEINRLEGVIEQSGLEEARTNLEETSEAWTSCVTDSTSAGYWGSTEQGQNATLKTDMDMAYVRFLTALHEVYMHCPDRFSEEFGPIEEELPDAFWEESEEPDPQE